MLSMYVCTECYCWHIVQFLGHATPTGPRPVPWNQLEAGTEMGVVLA